MLVMTKHFGEINLDDEKVIYFENGILGFEEYKRYTLLFDNENGDRSDVFWLQSLDEPILALPVLSPFLIREEYNPQVEDELIKPLGELTPENIVVMVSITIPSDVMKMSANLKAPFIINSDTKKGSQIIVENADYDIKYYFYDKLMAYKKAKGGE